MSSGFESSRKGRLRLLPAAPDAFMLAIMRTLPPINAVYP